MAKTTTELMEDLQLAAKHLIQATGSYYGHVAVQVPGKKQFMLQFMRPPLEPDSDYGEALFYDLNGKQLDGKRRPPEEIHIYTEAFKSHPEWNSVIHVHPEMAIVLSIVGQPLRAIDQQSRWFMKPVPIYPSASFAAMPKIGKDLARLMGKGCAVAMRGHGIVVAGRSIEEAFARAVIYERTARLLVSARPLGKVTYLSDEDVELSPPGSSPSAQWLWAYLKWKES